MPKTTKQHTWTAPQTRSVNSGRVKRVIFDPQRPGVEVTYEIGEEVAGVFTERPDLRVVHTFAWDDIPAGPQTDLQGLEEKLMTFAENNGIFEAGALETDPSN